MITVHCSGCQRSLSVPDQFEGKRAKCKHCNSIIFVPQIEFAALCQAGDEEEAYKPCPFCGEQVLAVAKKCKHCGEFMAEPPKGFRLLTTMRNVVGKAMNMIKRDAKTRLPGKRNEA